MRVLIIPNYDKHDALNCTNQILKKLSAMNVHTDILESDFRHSKEFSDSDCVLIEKCDIVITVGGDGTTIRSAKAAALYNKPVLGINAGRLGYMSGLEKNELDSLSALTDGAYKIENRMMLDVTLFDSDNNIACTMRALNDAVLSRGAQSRILDLDIALNENTTITCRADGIIFSTPTGSTAYAFSAGGPVIDPLINCIQLTPICSHSLLSRPMVLSKHSVLRAKASANVESDIYLTVDGEGAIPLKKGNYIEVRRSEAYAKLIRIKDDCFYDILKTKFKD